MDTSPPFALYNPALLPPEVLLSEFTARRPLLARLLDIIRANDAGEPPQHVLCVGPRGMGKSTLLCAIAATIKLREPELAKQWQPVIFDEESRRIGDLADFWLECIRQWESETEPHLTRSHRIDALLVKPGPDIEDEAREVFLALVDAAGKRALLLIDNLNDIFIAVNDAESLMRLRSFLMSDPRVMIIGAATRWFSDVTGLDKPFFEFFRPFELQALSLVEMRECLAGVATSRGDQRVLDTLHDRPGSIEVLHILTGGNPRLIRTFYRLLNEGMNGELRLQLERLIDDYTPYHKAIIDALPGQQQRVLDAIALEWNPCDVATVARVTRLPSNQVSAQIKALIKAGLISEAANMGHSKKKAYLLTDRFSNIHYLMRHGRTGKLKMHWFVMMLRALFGDKEFAEAAAKSVRLTASCGTSFERDCLLLAQNVIEHAGSETARREFMDRMVGSPEFDREIDVVLAEKVCLQAIASNPGDAYSQFKWGRLLHVHLKRYPEAEIAYRKAIELDTKSALPWHNLGNLLTVEFGRHPEAETAFRKAIELDAKDASPWNSLGILLTGKLGRPAEAETTFRKAIELDPRNARSWYGLGILLTGKLGRHTEAETAFRKAIELDSEDAWPWICLGKVLTDELGRYHEAETAYRKAIELDPENAWSWNELGILLAEKLGRHTEAETAYRKAIELNPTYDWSWISLGNLLSDKLGRHTEAETAYRKAIELNPKYDWPWICLANLLTDKLGRHAEAEAAYRKAIQLDPKLASPWNSLGNLLTDKLDCHIEAETSYRKAIELNAQFASPWNGLGNLLTNKLGRHAEAEAAYRKAIELDPELSAPWNGLGILLSEKLGYHTEAEAAYRKAIQLDEEFAWPWNNLGALLTYGLDRHEEAEAAFLKAIELDPANPKARSSLASVLLKLGRSTEEAFASAVEGFKVAPSDSWARSTFHDLCFSHPGSLRSVLPELSHWCTQHPDDQDVLSFMVDAWMAYAKVTSASEARELLDAQPDEVKLAFETVRDAFLAHDDKDHLHRLAPERLAPVLRLLERL
ncbi:tetratricopeptide (TPR) repeat protein [Prosthecobacter fusiformis]|uniref:Tetratricopeptide (TPR) repeat protein n=1 Tax=Prosthecobacter fusiformis TaxID=48464 RepID=A0A4R7RMD9_9BACT|nr:tetratricopeptide repeat protein [Prosthecobacter fusiformis]TDU64124.1 tetratricopeptide (TPR) repeat protein [Prosthecobacter fusiformis]